MRRGDETDGLRRRRRHDRRARQESRAARTRRIAAAELVYADDPLAIEYARDATRLVYATPAGDATYDGETMRANGGVADGPLVETLADRVHRCAGMSGQQQVVRRDGFRRELHRADRRVAAAVSCCKKRPALWGNPRGFRLDGALVTILFVSTTVYALAWVPDLARHSADPNEIHNLNDVVYRQYSMFEYHDTLKATHPYSSKWWEWPLDYVPVAYYYQDHRTDQSNPQGCCIYEITSMPSPAILWFGLFCVPWVAVLAWRERNKGYVLIVLTYLLQWLPWMQSPRITFAYHFYVNIPLICLCNAIVLQRAWEWGKRQMKPRGTWLGGLAVGAYVALAIGCVRLLLSDPRGLSHLVERLASPDVDR